MEPLFLHTARPNPADCDWKDPSNPEEQNTREYILLDFALFWFPALVCVIRGALSGRFLDAHDWGRQDQSLLPPAI